MCKSLTKMCISCASSVRKEKACAKFNEVRETEGYEDIYEEKWMMTHIDHGSNEVEIIIEYTFCPNCQGENKDGFKPNVNKICKRTEKVTSDCLGNFKVYSPKGNLLTSWIKTDFVKLDPDLYLTTDAEVTDAPSDDDDDDDDDNDNQKES